MFVYFNSKRIRTEPLTNIFCYCRLTPYLYLKEIILLQAGNSKQLLQFLQERSRSFQSETDLHHAGQHRTVQISTVGETSRQLRPTGIEQKCINYVFNAADRFCSAG